MKIATWNLGLERALARVKRRPSASLVGSVALALLHAACSGCAASAPVTGAPSTERTCATNVARGRPALEGECTFNLNSVPPSETFIDGACAGTTPSLDLRVGVGDHLVRFVTSSGASKQLTVNCSAGKTKTVAVRIEPRDPAEAAAEITEDDARSSGNFDRKGARSAMSAAATQAQSCAKADGPHGRFVIVVRYGNVGSVYLLAMP